MIYFTSDLHFGHKNIIKYRPEFSSIEEHDNILFDNFSKLNKKDIIYVLGDFIFNCKEYDYYIEQFKKMSCRIKLILGNHDSLKLLNEDRFEHIRPLVSYKNYWISHAPIHPNEIRYRLGNIHGHIHKEKINNNLYYNVNIDVNDYKFINFDIIKDILKKNK